MSIRNIRRQATVPGTASGASAPIYVDSDDNILKMIPAGSGTTEVQIVDVSSTQTLANKKISRPAPILLAAATLTLAQATHDGATVVITKTDGTTITLPAATGSGARFRIVQGAKVASSATVIQVPNATDYFRGAQYGATDNGSGAGLTWPTTNTGTVATETDTLTWNGGTQGGNIGDVVEFEDVAAAVWLVKSAADQTGTEATPFSAAV